ncbi:MAG: toll/interleukin-1 receptor domain-containing protein, partial [Pseudomonadota bacterium]
MFGREIFISYRREDAGPDARNIYDRLARAFGRRHIFMDIDKLPKGKAFDVELERALRKSNFVLVVIGPQWTSILKKRAESNETDFMRQEISTAIRLKRNVCPVLVNGAALPRRDDLPDDLKELPAYQSHAVRFEAFGRDIKALIDDIKLQGRWRRRLGACIFAVLVVAAFAFFHKPIVQTAYLLWTRTISTGVEEGSGSSTG